MRRRQVVDYLILAGVWGTSFVLVLKVVRVFGWVAAVAFRALIAGSVLVALAALTRRRLAFGRWQPLAVVGATTVAGQLVGISVAAPLIGTAMVAIVVGTIPLFSMVIGQAWGVEALTTAHKVGLVLGFLGVVLLVGFPSSPVTVPFLLGCATAVLGSISAAVGSNYARVHLPTVGAWEQSIGAFLLGGAFMLPLLLVAPVPGRPAVADYLTLALLAAVCSSLAYVLYFRLIVEVGATIAVSVEFLVTVVAVVVGVVLLGERLSVAQLIGGGVIIAGCALVLGLLPRPGRLRTPAARARRPGDVRGGDDGVE